MVKVYSCQHDGSVSKLGDSNYWITNEVAEKSASMEDRNGSWKNLHGITLFVSNVGVIEKGPEALLGKSLNDVTRLQFNDVYRIMRNEQIVKEIMGKSLLLGPTQVSKLTIDDQIRIKSIREENENLLNEKIELSKKAEDSRKDPLYLNV